ncbi:uncharacterized protein M421DRAFT_50382 [Didymella exigua CBS 183.55]|uniref:Uncharacterized protein n=1 Tax=Didymella exigua CBS 183.55 TaxID=1150837 RepID=A0A6A5S3B8_9PLEO|nr:uncharacterized protein M421DRAFT_50382 [Didymella exigua CBS 183.55]KAF1934249.1 hypothetical protein M421DRAFT_50382 [Didymella exigua CBS 183.55]
MAANTSSRGHPLQHEVLVSPISDEINYSPIPNAEMKSKTWETTVTRVPSWPEQARQLKKHHHDWVTVLFALGDVILVVLPIYFVLLGVAVVTLNGKVVEGNAFATKVTSAIQLGPTLFPIMFAAISGRSMKMIARYLAEKGAKLSTLELLMASQSVWGTVESQFLMRRLTIVGVNLLFLWAMSPLGGQASLRLLERSTSTDSTFMPLRYLSTGAGSAVWAMTSGTYVENDGALTQVEPLYAAALFGSDEVKRGAEDTWGNVKIPFMYDLNSSWSAVPANISKPEDYRALVGIPVIGRPMDRDGSFNLETSHLTVECEPFETTIVGKYNYTELQKLVPGQIWQNMSETDSPWSQKNAVGGKTATFFLQTDLPLSQGDDGRFDAYAGYVNTSANAQPYPKRKITYASTVGFEPLGNTTLNFANCSLGQIHIETTVECTMDKCSAVQQRRSLIDTRDENVTPFDHILIAQLALKAFPKTFGWSRGSNPTEQFLFNATAFQFVSPTSNLGDNSGWVDLAQLSTNVFAKRLSLLLNTYYQLTIAPNAYLGNLPQNNYSAFGLDTAPVDDVNVYLSSNVTTKNTTFVDWYFPFQDKTYASGIYFIGATTNSTVSKTHAIFVCNFAWLGLLIAAAATIFATGVASLVLKWKTLGPEMFGFVTSMTYENRFVNIPNGGTMLNGMERARLLKDVEFCVGDVRGDDDVGHIAFAAGVPLRKLEHGRLYC